MNNKKELVAVIDNVVDDLSQADVVASVNSVFVLPYFLIMQRQSRNCFDYLSL